MQQYKVSRQQAHHDVAKEALECAECSNCSADVATPLECYFGRGSVCPLPDDATSLPMLKPDFNACPPWGPGRAAAYEYVFRRLPDRIVEQTERAAAHLYRNGGPHVSVHMRWGDKWTENDLPSVAAYIEGVKRVSKGCGLPAHLIIFVMTEDPSALAQFKKQAPSEWTVLYHAPALGMGGVVDARDHTSKSRKTPPQDAAATGGSQGLHSLVALMLSLESSAFVLTGSSNWSRMWEDVIHAKANKMQNCRQVLDVCKFGGIRRNRSGGCPWSKLANPDWNFNLTEWTRAV